MANNPKTIRIKNALPLERHNAMGPHEGMPQKPEDFPGTWAAKVAKQDPAAASNDKTAGTRLGPVKLPPADTQ